MIRVSMRAVAAIAPKARRRRRARRVIAALALGLASVTGCGNSRVFVDGGPDDAPVHDAEATVDAPEIDAPEVDATVDAPTDAAVDAAIDAPTDAAPDAAGTRPPPITTALMPAQLDCGSAPVTLAVTGDGFAMDSTVRLAGHDLATTYGSPQQLTAVVPPADVTVAGTFPVTVFTPPPGGGTSAALSFTVQAAPRVIAVTPIDFLTPAEGGLFASYQIDQLAVDWDQDLAYFVLANADASLAGLRRFRISTMAEDRQARLSEVLDPAFPMNGFLGALHSDGAGSLYGNLGSSNSRPLIRIDTTSLHELGRFGTTGNGLTNTTTSLVALRWMAAGGGYVATGSLFNDTAIVTRDLGYVWGAGQRLDEPRIGGLVAGASGPTGTDFWLLGTSNALRHTTLALYRVHVDPGAHFDPVLGTVGVTRTKVATFTPAQIDPAAVELYSQAGGLVYDETDGGVIFQVQVASGTAAGPWHTVKWRGGNLVWNVVTPFAINYEGPFESQYRTRGGLWTLMRAGRLIQLDTATGATFGDDLPQVSEGGAQVYDGGANLHLVRVNAGWAKIALRRCHL